MQVHEIKWVFVIPKHTPSQWLAACLPEIPVRRKQHDTHHSRLPHRKGMHRGHLSYVALICSNVTLISWQDGQADGIFYGNLILLAVVQQLLMLC